MPFTADAAAHQIQVTILLVLVIIFNLLLSF